MKTLTLIISMIASIPAFASPAVGDYVKYKYTYSNMNESFEVSEEITSFNSVKDEFIVTKTHSSPNEQDIVTEKVIPRTTFKKEEEENASVLKNCEGISGPGIILKKKTVTVPAGTFKVCEISTNFAETAIRENSFRGMVSHIIKGHMKVELVESRRGIAR